MIDNLISDKEIDWARDQLGRMDQNVRIEFATSREIPPGIVGIRDILATMESCTIVENSEALPTHSFFTIASPGSGRVVYRAIPLDHQWRPFISTLRAFSTGESALTEDVRTAITAITAPITIEVLISTQCPHCADVVSMVTMVAASSACVTATITDVQQLPDVAEKWAIQAVPAIIVDNRPAFFKDIDPRTFTAYLTGPRLERRKRELISYLGDRRLKEAVALVIEDADMKSALADLAASPLLSTRIGAITLLEELVEAKPGIAADFLPLLLDYLDTADSAVCCDIIMALSIIGDPKASPYLKRLLLSDDEDIRDSAREALDMF